MGNGNRKPGVYVAVPHAQGDTLAVAAVESSGHVSVLWVDSDGEEDSIRFGSWEHASRHYRLVPISECAIPACTDTTVPTGTVFAYADEPNSRYAKLPGGKVICIHEAIGRLLSSEPGDSEGREVVVHYEPEQRKDY